MAAAVAGIVLSPNPKGKTPMVEWKMRTYAFTCEKCDGDVVQDIEMRLYATMAFALLDIFHSIHSVTACQAAHTPTESLELV